MIEARKQKQPIAEIQQMYTQDVARYSMNGCAIILSLAMCACDRATPAQQQFRVFEDLLKQVQVRQESNEPESSYTDRLRNEFGAAISSVDSARQLHDLFVLSDQLAARLVDGNARDSLTSRVGFEIRKAASFRLARLDTDEAAVTLVSIYGEPAISLDGEEAINFSYAITMCGERALLPLKELRRQKRGRSNLDELILHIEQGSLYEP